jgi:rubrerythrin
VIDVNTQKRLLKIARRESRSLLSYVSEAFPWPAPEEQEALAEFQRLAQEESKELGALLKFLAREHIFPAPATFPMNFTTINFISLEHLFPMLIDYERRTLAELEKDEKDILDPEARTLVQRLVATKRRHLQTLETLASAHPETSSTVH